ncbi:MAG: hypothetical protein Q8R16_01735, partial [bacterium]|nr:hypothetical protein [bacterium]
MPYVFAVVTHVAPYPGNHAIVDSDLWIDKQFTADRKPVLLTAPVDNPTHASLQRFQLWLSLRAPVFHVGEILILGP